MKALTFAPCAFSKAHFESIKKASRQRSPDVDDLGDLYVPLETESLNHFPRKSRLNPCDLGIHLRPVNGSANCMCMAHDNRRSGQSLLLVGVPC